MQQKNDYRHFLSEEFSSFRRKWCSKSPRLFAEMYLKDHCTKPFSRMHKEVFKLLVAELIANNFTYMPGEDISKLLRIKTMKSIDMLFDYGLAKTECGSVICSVPAGIDMKEVEEAKHFLTAAKSCSSPLIFK